MRKAALFQISLHALAFEIMRSKIMESKKMKRFIQRMEKGIRAVSVLVTVITMWWLTYFFSESLISCLLLVWKHTAGHMEVPVLGSAFLFLPGGRRIR